PSRRSTDLDVATTARSLNNAISNNQDQLPRIAQKTERALDQFAVAMNNINSLVDDPQMRQDMKQALRDFPQLVRDTTLTLNRANAAFDSMKLASDEAQPTLANAQNL